MDARFYGKSSDRKGIGGALGSTCFLVGAIFCSLLLHAAQRHGLDGCQPVGYPRDALVFSPHQVAILHFANDGSAATLTGF